MFSSVRNRLSPLAVMGLAACAGQQHVPPAADATDVAAVIIDNRGGRSMEVWKLQFNKKRCFQGYTDVTRSTEAKPVRVESGAPVFFSARYSSGNTFCEVVTSFTPEAGHRYVVSAERISTGLLSLGSCSASVAGWAPDGSLKPVVAERWKMVPQGIACIRPVAYPPDTKP